MTKIKELRQDRGLSIAGLCYETRIHPTTLSMVERRRLAASQRVKEVVSSFLGIPQEQAFDGDGLAV